MRVLVIDNEAQVLEGMTSLLDTWRCRVIAASNAEGALSELDRTGETAGAVAGRLPSWIDGRRRHRGDPRHRAAGRRGIPAAIITADHSPAIQNDVHKIEGVSLLLKPIKPARLRALIASVRE